MQQRSLESNLFNKSNELQEEIGTKRFDLQVAQIHYAAVKAQRDLFASKVEASGEGGRERKSSGSSERAGMKTKWLKAFKSLKSSGFNKDTGQDRRNGREGSRPPDGPTAASLPVGAHWFQEYTYKKITACDTCNQILRGDEPDSAPASVSGRPGPQTAGHTRQGLKCRLCKMNVHVECQGSVPRCQPKSRLLRRQKSTSELETRYIEGAEDPTGAEATDPVYDLLKQAAAKRKESSLPPPTPIIRGHTRQGLKCRLCKMNVHVECQGSVPRCQPKSRLLRRQKSTSELETRYIEGAEDPTGAEATDPVYDLLKQAAAKRKESSLP
ncbi:SH3 and cysteine-rich domain-containing protein-like, partial [Pollicipes pollicipes]|uniref:SH3 and cysteine-rich domain-containing protein-like n=1 Tax=Pollicipes pollicipes TaxID=41117 RepID=UPI0018850E04